MGKGDAPPPSPENTVHVVIAGITDVGQVRDHNEDAFLIASLGDKSVDRSSDGHSGPLPPAGLLFAVADGMGGAASGEVASRMAVDTLTDQLRDGYPPDADQEVLQRGLEGALTTANERIFAVASQDAKHRGMGTTMTVVLASGDRICFSQIGDSRAYLLRKGELVQITKDQSLIEQLIEDGTLTPEEAEHIGGKNIILQALGVEDAVRADTRHLELLDEDVLLVCSDGLSGMISDAETQEILADVPEPAEACRLLIARANEAGGRDNISVIVARFSGGGLRAPAGATGALFVPAKPPPGAAGGRSRRKLGLLAALAAAALVFAVLVLTSGSSPLVLQFNVGGVRGTLVPLDSGGNPDRSRTIEFTVDAGKMEYRIDDVETGQWQLEVVREGYRSDTVEFDVSAGGSTVRVDLVAHARKILVKTTVPGAEILLERSDGAYDERRYAEGAEVLFFRDPGRYELVIRARGYVTHREDVIVSADRQPDPLEVALKENKGILVLAGAVAGSRFKVTDQNDRVLEGVLPDNGELSLRDGDYDIEITEARHRSWIRSGIRVAGGERGDPITVDQKLRKVKVRVKVGPLAREGVDRVEVVRPGESDMVVRGLLPDPDGEGFANLTFLLDEGEYEIVVGDTRKKVSAVAGETPPPVVFQ